MSVPDPVDTLVRAYLDRQAARVDPGPTLDRIRRTLARDRPGEGRSRRPARRRWAMGAVAASALGIAVAGTLAVRLRPANAESIVRQAREAHALPTDRCYRVETRPESWPPDDGSALLARPRQTRLWTRGDRFWIESDVGARHLNWGRDEGGTIWLALSPRRGIRFEPAEVPEAVGFRCDVLSVRPETLLGEVLKDFDLRTEPGPEGGPHPTTIIHAEPRPGRRTALRQAVLEVDAKTKVLRRMVLTRRLAGHPVTTTFTLEDSRTIEDARYQLEGHLEAPYQVFRRDFEPHRRRQLLLRLFGFRPGEQSTSPPGDRP